MINLSHISRALADRVEHEAAFVQPVRLDTDPIFHRGRRLGHWHNAPRSSSCRFIRAADTWIIVNLARPEDQGLVAAWLRSAGTVHGWDDICREALVQSANELVDHAILLGLPVARVGEITSDGNEDGTLTEYFGDARFEVPRVVDMSSLWAGPLCGSLLQSAGAKVIKMDSVKRPDALRAADPLHYEYLNSGKSHICLDLDSDDGLRRLHRLVETADVLITNSRPRALTNLGISQDRLRVLNPSLIWIAITGFGLGDVSGTRVAFGNEAAAAGGLVEWDDGVPRSAGDAIADPITGLMAAVSGLRAWRRQRACTIDASLAHCAAACVSIATRRH